MRSRKVQMVLGVAVVAVAVVVVLLLIPRRAEGPYALTAWDYGAIAWVEPPSDDLNEVAARANELIADVFELWGFSLPEVVEDGRVARRSDPAGGESVDLRAIEWKGVLLPPLMIVVFADLEGLQEAAKQETAPVTLTYGAAPSPDYFEDPSSAAPSAPSTWLVDLTGASVAFVCTAERWEEQLVWQVSKWMLDAAVKSAELCECEPSYVASVVRAGFGGYTASQLLGDDTWETKAREWAAENGIEKDVQNLLQFDVDEDTRRALGTSLIAYLVEEHSLDGLVYEICDWWGHDSNRYSEHCSVSTFRTLSYIDGWKEYLGLMEE